MIYFEAYSTSLKEVNATGIFKRGFAGLYVYDEVKITDNDPPVVETPTLPPIPGDATPPGTALPGATGVAGTAAPNTPPANAPATTAAAAVRP